MKLTILQEIEKIKITIFGNCFLIFPTWITFFCGCSCSTAWNWSNEAPWSYLMKCSYVLRCARPSKRWWKIIGTIMWKPVPWSAFGAMSRISWFPAKRESSACIPWTTKNFFGRLEMRRQLRFSSVSLNREALLETRCIENWYGCFDYICLLAVCHRPLSNI